MQQLGRVMRAAVLTVFALGAGVGTALAQQVPMLTGTVTDRATGRPIGAARITVLSTLATAETNAEGKYTFRAALSGALRVRVNAIGYQSETKGVTITVTGEAGRKPRPTINPPAAPSFPGLPRPPGRADVQFPE